MNRVSSESSLMVDVLVIIAKPDFCAVAFVCLAMNIKITFFHSKTTTIQTRKCDASFLILKC